MMLCRVKRKSVGLFTSMSKLQQQSTKVLSISCYWLNSFTVFLCITVSENTG